MTSIQRVAFVGFTPFERSTLESYFRLAAARETVSHVIVQDLQDCDLVVANAEQPEALLAIGRAGRMRDTVLVGGPSAPASVGAHLARPIDALQIRRALDALSQRHQMSRPSGRARQQAADSPELVGDFRTSEGYSNSVMVEGELRLDEVLVVSTSPAERDVLDEMLSRCGYGVTLARSAERAIELCEAHSFGFVFLGLGQDGVDSYQVCRRIRRRSTGASIAPVVVALAHGGGAIDRIRATFAGCDAYLTTPLDESELVRLLAQHDRTFERVFEPTAPIQQ
jgi:CheY-like chemotaxis protein